MYSVITGDRQTRLAAYPPSPCERGLGASRFQQIQESFARFARVFRLARLVDRDLSLISIGCIVVGLVHAFWTSQQSASVVPEFVGRRSQLPVPSMLKYHGASVSGQKLQARTTGFDEEKTYTKSDVWTWKGLVPSFVLKTNAYEGERPQDPIFRTTDAN